MSQKMNPVFYSSLSINTIGRVYMAVTIHGLCFIGSPNKGKEELERWISTHFQKVNFIRDNEKLKSYKDELDQYFRGERKSMTAPMDLKGTPFQKEIWHTLRNIPYGETMTYSQVANMIGRPSATRAVAAAIGSNPALVSIPCHRVVGKDGTLTGYRGGLEMKKRLLQLEKENVGRSNIFFQSSTTGT